MDPQFRSRETPHDAPTEPVLPGPEPVPGGGRAPFDDRQHLVDAVFADQPVGGLDVIGVRLDLEPEGFPQGVGHTDRFRTRVLLRHLPGGTLVRG